MPNPPATLSRVAFFLPSLDGGGAERVYVNIANQFVEWGLAVDIVLIRKQGIYLRQLDTRVRVVDLQARSKPRSIITLARYLQQDPPDVLVSAMDIMNVVALSARLLAWSSVPVVVTSHIHMSSQVVEDRRLQNRAVPALARLLYPNANAVVAVSSGVADDLAKNSGMDRTRIKVIFNPVDIDSVQASALETPKHPWASRNQQPYLLSIGRLVPQKDYPTLFRAFAKIRQRRKLRLIVLGEGPERPALEGLISKLGLSESVQMPGFMENPFPLLQRAVALVLSSRWEGFGLVLIEALACGCQVISTDCPSGPGEILDDGRFGQLVPVGDIDALVQAVEQTLVAPQEPAYLKSRAEDFQVDAIARQYLEVLEGVMVKFKTGVKR